MRQFSAGAARDAPMPDWLAERGKRKPASDEILWVRKAARGAIEAQVAFAENAGIARQIR
jgi:hypothetical protein